MTIPSSTVIYQTVPDFPGTLQEFRDLALRSVKEKHSISQKKKQIYANTLLSTFSVPSFRNSIDVDDFAIFLKKLSDEDEQIDNLRLPLQVALLISPIFLLQEAQIHLSTFYNQRYKLALVSFINLIF